MAPRFLSRKPPAPDLGALRRRAEAEDARGAFVKAAPLWRELAGLGDLEACHVLAERYEAGKGVVQNFVEATRWFQTAAEGGLVQAQAKLGEIYFHGRDAPAGVSPDATPAATLERLFPGGLTVPQDFRKAAHWNLMAADADDTAAQVRWAYQCAAGLGLRQDYPEAELWFAAAADKGHEGGALGLAMLYAGGHTGEPDPAKAVVWFEKAAAQGNSGATS